MKKTWHVWVVGILTLFWNSVGAFDYLMTATKNDSYMANFSAEQLEFFYGFPKWADAAWACGVWFSVLGSLLLLFGSRHALWAFVVSFIGMNVTTSYSYILAETSMINVAGPEALAFSAVIFVVAILLIWYARRMKQVGVLC